MKSSIAATENTVDCDGARWELSFEFKQQLIYAVGCLDEWQFQVIDANVNKNVLWRLHHFQSFDRVDSILDVRGPTSWQTEFPIFDGSIL